VQYRAFVLDKAGRIRKRHYFDAADDAAAIEIARQFLIGNRLQVWQLSRLVITLYPPRGAAPVSGQRPRHSN